MSILITGSAGFIGSHLSEKLLEEEYKVIGIDNFDSYYDPSIKRKNLEKCLSKTSFDLMEVDIRNESELKKVLKNKNIKKVVHLAARAGVRPSVENPQLYEEVNVRGTLNLLELSRRNEVKNFIFGSSSSVYGDINEIPFREDGPKNPVSPYAASKLAAEIYCKAYSQLHDLNTTVLRFFTVYGPRQRPEMAIHKFVRMVEQGKPIPMYGDGSSKRDYTYIDDIIQGIMSSLKKDFKFETFNLGNNRTVKLKKLIKIIEEKTGKTAKINRKPMQKGDVTVTYADISRAKELLDYGPKTPIEEGVERFVEWFRKNKRTPIK